MREKMSYLIYQHNLEAVAGAVKNDEDVFLVEYDTMEGYTKRFIAAAKDADIEDIINEGINHISYLSDDFLSEEERNELTEHAKMNFSYHFRYHRRKAAEVDFSHELSPDTWEALLVLL